MKTILVLIVIATAVLALAMHSTKEFYKTNITVYSGNETSTGINPDTYPISVHIPGVGKKSVYPIAVHDKEYKKDRCKIIKVTKGTTSFYGHVVNRCNKKHPNCKNRHKKGAQYLVDFYYKDEKDYKKQGLKYDVNPGKIEHTNHKVSALDLDKKHWHSWLTKNHVMRSNGYTCDGCC